MILWNFWTIVYLCMYSYLVKTKSKLHQSYACPTRIVRCFQTSTNGPCWKNLNYHISANSFRGNYPFLNLTLCTVTFGNSTFMCGNYSREETIQGLKLYEEIRYTEWLVRFLWMFRLVGSRHPYRSNFGLKLLWFK